MGKSKSERRHRYEQAVVSRVTAACSWLVQRLSLTAVRKLADIAALLVMVLFQRRQRLAEANIAAAFPEFTPAEVKRVRWESVRNICRTMLELLKLPSLTPEEVRRLTDTSQMEPMRAALAAGHGVMILSAHFGNWEWMGAIGAQFGVPLYVIARDAPHSLTARLINEARASHGMRVIGREDLRAMLSALRSGAMLGILPDQHALEGGVLVDFLGRPAWTFTGPALLAARTGAHVFPMGCARQPDGTFRIEVLPEVEIVDTGDRENDLLTNTRRINAAIEEIIRMYPGQWLWMHDRWKQARAHSSEEPHHAGN